MKSPRYEDLLDGFTGDVHRNSDLLSNSLKPIKYEVRKPNTW